MTTNYKYYDLLLDFPDYEGWVYNVPLYEVPTMFKGFYVLEYRESDND